MDCNRIDRNTDFLKKIGPKFRLAVLIAVVLINKKACNPPDVIVVRNSLNLRFVSLSVSFRSMVRATSLRVLKFSAIKRLAFILASSLNFVMFVAALQCASAYSLYWAGCLSLKCFKNAAALFFCVKHTEMRGKSDRIRISNAMVHVQNEGK